MYYFIYFRHHYMKFGQKKELWRHDHPKAQHLTKLIGEMICLDLKPYSLVQDTGFKRLMNHLAPNYSIPNRTHFSTKVVPLLYETVKAKVKFELDNAKYVSLTTDGWTCQHNIKSFYSLTARFVTDTFELVHVILQVKYFQESHTAINIGKFINESLQSTNLSLNLGSRIMAIFRCTFSLYIEKRLLNSFLSSSTTVLMPVAVSPAKFKYFSIE